MEKNKKILIVAGEASGDMHAARLVSAIKKIFPAAEFFGLGGEKLKQEGVILYCNIVELAVVGFFEVLKNFQKFRRIFRGLLDEIDKNKPALAILVDYPGFNLRLAEELKKRNIPVIYYISPQIWAWGKKRIHDIKRLVSHMIVVFKFEDDLYRQNNIPVSFVGHPLLEMIKVDTAKEAFLNKFGLQNNNLTIALLPGSREKEVKTLLPIMLESAQYIHAQLKNTQFIILRSQTVKEEIFRSLLPQSDLTIRLISDMTYDGLNASDFAIVASGTATLETAILEVPMVIVYKVSFLTWLIIRSLIKIPYIGLVNVVRQRKFIKEFIQYDARPKKIAEYVTKILKNPVGLNDLKEELRKVRACLGEKGASEKAAKIIVERLA